MIYDADGFAAVLPSDKREIVLTLRNHYGLVTGSKYFHSYASVVHRQSSDRFLDLFLK